MNTPVISSGAQALDQTADQHCAEELAALPAPWPAEASADAGDCRANLDRLFAAAQALGAEGIWLIQGAAEAMLSFWIATIGEAHVTTLAQPSDLIVLIRVPQWDSSGVGLSTIAAQAAVEGICRECGCTEEYGCDSPDDDAPCYWVEPSLCSRCARQARARPAQ